MSLLSSPVYMILLFNPLPDTIDLYNVPKNFKLSENLTRMLQFLLIIFTEYMLMTNFKYMYMDLYKLILLLHTLHSLHHTY